MPHIDRQKEPKGLRPKTLGMCECGQPAFKRSGGRICKRCWLIELHMNNKSGVRNWRSLLRG